MTPYRVTKCVCKKITFKEIKVYVEEHGVQDVEELRDAGVCSSKCRMCDPYIRLMMETGETEFKPGAFLGNKAG
ncbi:MAG TPA: hypothetical protein DEQ34_12355 [Balneolaceae bacterium]|nr:hypothetical protein [Balneolaceae bacterium]|tara:strand:+ start:10416 stop:10637 length:222 start_codon:yes stop_codon:yes gene_type:complete